MVQSLSSIRATAHRLVPLGGPHSKLQVTKVPMSLSMSYLLEILVFRRLLVY